MRAILIVGTFVLSLGTLLPASSADHGDAGAVATLDRSVQLAGTYTSGGGCAQTWDFKMVRGVGLPVSGKLFGCWEGGFSGTIGGVALAVSGTGVPVGYCSGPALGDGVYTADVTVTMDGAPHAGTEVVTDLLCP